MVSDRRVGYLEELEHELGSRGLVARVVRTRSGPAFLRVVNPDAASLAEDVTCAPAPESRDHYYWWSWGERMHRVDDPGGAAVKLAHVLQPLRLEQRREVCGHRAQGRAVRAPALDLDLEWQTGHP
ncbi:hypothetical protein [Actinomadura macrotermitis]|uniref:Uncharacterized protein n=1 Tax=Actinomadura macrotermitis TaxID=2585200 RepID=A0A7K0BYU8_9ACTN|nr:hypothetical protein [Actinomadura macrotermitis]